MAGAEVDENSESDPKQLSCKNSSSMSCETPHRAEGNCSSVTILWICHNEQPLTLSSHLLHCLYVKVLISATLTLENVVRN